MQEEKILEALSAVIDPDFRKDIVSLGFVQNLKIDAKAIAFDLKLTTPACPVKDQFKDQCLEYIAAIYPEAEVSINFTAQEQKKNRLDKGGLSQVQSIIAVSSAKGGVGKSTVAATLASELAARGFRTGLLDLDVYGPSVPSLYGIQRPQLGVSENDRVIPKTAGMLKLMSFGFLLGDSPAILRGPVVSNYVQQLLFQVEWGALDYLIVDLPPGTGDIQLTVTQSVGLDGAVVVSTQQALSLVDVAKGILMFEKVNVPVLGVVQNMSYLDCECGQRHYPFGRSKDSLRERFGLETLAELPISPSFSGKFDDFTSFKESALLCDAVVQMLGKKSHEKIDPPRVEHDEEKVTFHWPDGGLTPIPNLELRYASKSALDVDEMTGEQLTKKEELRPDIKAESVTVLGNYAVNIHWNDGHSAGIYPYEQIRALFRELKEAGKLPWHKEH